MDLAMILLGVAVGWLVGLVWRPEKVEEWRERIATAIEELFSS